MPGIPSRSLWVPAILAIATAFTGCASTSTVRPPAAFPMAPPPPAFRAPIGTSSQFAASRFDLVRTAYDLQGVNYRFGGESPAGGFDCSGFIQYVFALNHLTLPRTVVEQYRVGVQVTRREVREGDLIFFSTLAPGATHVGLAIGPDAFIHAPAEGAAVRIDRLDTPYWRDRIVGIRRVL
jgi:cell wall-associated NlpC family hydrolase